MKQILIILVIIFINSCKTINYTKPQPVFYSTDRFKTIETGTLIGYTRDSKSIILTEGGWRMHLPDSLIIKE